MIKQLLNEDVIKLEGIAILNNGYDIHIKNI